MQPQSLRDGYGRLRASMNKGVAERVGFEPTVPSQARRISSAVLSTSQPPLRGIWSTPFGAAGT